jgi:glycerophosphoryl diester phosphodiesterase
MWPYPKIVAHRGGGTLAPENTVAGLRAGLAYGFRAVEFDVMLSRDGIGMVMHDPDFGRTVAGQGSVPGTDAVELAAMDAGSWFGPQFHDEPVPFFTQFIDYCKAQRIWMNVEIKPADGFERETGDWVAKVTRDSYAAELAAGSARCCPRSASTRWRPPATPRPSCRAATCWTRSPPTGRSRRAHWAPWPSTPTRST